MTHDDPEQRERAQAQSDQAVQELLAVRQQLELAQAQSDQSLQELLAVTQELARQQRHRRVRGRHHVTGPRLSDL